MGVKWGVAKSITIQYIENQYKRDCAPRVVAEMCRTDKASSFIQFHLIVGVFDGAI